MKIKTNTSGTTGPHVAHGGVYTIEGVDVGGMIAKAVVSIDPDNAVMARCDIYLCDLDIDGAVIKINGIEAPEKLKEALREYFMDEPMIGIEKESPIMHQRLDMPGLQYINCQHKNGG